MKYVIPIAILFAVFFTSNINAEVTPIKEALLKSEQEPSFNAQEKQALKIAKEWKSNNFSTKPIKGADGSVSYFFGLSQPSLICSPMEVCTIKLEPGEFIQPGGLHSGDTVRWTIIPAVVGSGSNIQTHIIVKPTQVGLITSLYVGTDRRAYNIKLKSSRFKFMPWLSFIYPQKLEDSLDQYEQRLIAVRSRGYIPAAVRNADMSSDELQYGSHIEDLSFNYKIKGKAPWKPERVYNDGVRTVIHMPKEMEAVEAPSLLVIDSSGNENLVNYRLKDRAFIVDQIFNEAILVVGVGGDQEKITITRT